MKLMKVMISENHQLSQVHVTAIEGTEELLFWTGLRRPTMVAKEKGEGAVLTIHQSCNRGEWQI